MIAELGQFALVLGLCLSLAQAGLSFAGRARRDAALTGAGEGAAIGAFVCVAIGFATLIFTFVTSDFSVVNVAENSHTEKPLIYKIAGAWGSHEGSILLWCFALTAYGAAVAAARGLPWGLKALTVAVQGSSGRPLRRLYGAGLQPLAAHRQPARGGALAQSAPAGSGPGGPSAVPLRGLCRAFGGLFLALAALIEGGWTPPGPAGCGHGPWRPGAC